MGLRWIVATRFGLVCLFLLTLSCTKRSQDIGDRVVVKVNDSTLNAKDFAAMLGARLRVYDALTAKDPANVKRVKQDIIREYIVNVFTEEYARAHDILVRKEDLDLEINSVRSNYPDDFSFREALAQEGLTLKQWQDRMRITILNRLVQAAIKKDVPAPTDEDIRTYYRNNRAEFQRPDEVRLRQIVVSSEFEAQNIEGELKKGGRLKELAQKFSVAPEASLGGDLGWIQKGTLDIFDRAFKMAKGERSGIVKSPYGFHIFEVTDRRKAQVLPLEEVKKSIIRVLMEKREQAVYASWLETETRRSKVFQDDNLIASIQVETRSEN